MSAAARRGRLRRVERGSLPPALGYYMRELGALRGSGPWRKALCCFHDDHHPSLSVNVETGGFHCFACDARGDLVAFQMRRYDMDFRSACKALGTWV